MQKYSDKGLLSFTKAGIYDIVYSMKSYEEIINIIENSRRFESLPGVEVTRRVLERIGNPLEDAGIPFIHVAGTNGKGSVCAFLTSIFREAGLKVGTFTSPHLIDFCERIQVSGQMIPREAVTAMGNYLLDMDFGVSLTMFDYCLAMALLYFRQSGCRVVILETGLGGRLDSTNAVGIPMASVITKIGLDHTAILGDNLIDIAGEKAGIIKKGSRIFIGSQQRPVEEVFIKAAEEAGLSPSDIYILKEADIGRTGKYKLKMLGEFQKENAAAAGICAEYVLEQLQIEARERLIKKGLEEALWPGRMEIISRKPFLMVDGAHNENGVRALRDSLEKMYPGEKFHFVMGVMADKDYESMVEDMLPLAESFMAVRPDSSRALQAESLADFIRSRGVEAHSVDRLEAFIDAFRNGTTTADTRKTIAFGSLYFIGELKEKFPNQEEK